MNWSRLAAIRTLCLVLAGFAGIAFGAFLLQDWAGWITLGIGLVLIAYLTDSAPGARG